jgi:dolichol-phosphate mannosyltransferase
MGPSQTQSSQPSLSVVIPVHNEQGNIAPLLDEVAAAVNEMALAAEIVVVDDGSSDGTAAALEDASVRHSILAVVRHRHNRGQSAALLSGVLAANGPWIATLDGDGQNNPADLPKLWDAVTGDGDPRGLMVVGHRRTRRDTWVRRVSSRIANAVRGGLLSDGTPDTGCGLKVFERDVFLGLPHFDHFHRFLPALMQRAGGRVRSVEIGHRPRQSGASHYGIGNRLWVGLVDLAGVLWLGRRAAPWRLDARKRGNTEVGKEEQQDER